MITLTVCVSIQDEIELCSATAQFESFVLQFLDRYVYHSIFTTMVGRSGIVRRINKVALRLARLVLGWVTVFQLVYHLGM